MRPRYSIIPSAAVYDRRLKGRDLHVLNVLGVAADSDSGWCWRSQREMGEEIGCSRATVQASIARLVDAGYVEVRQRRRKDGGDASNAFRVVMDVSDETVARAEEEAFRREDAEGDDSGAAIGEGEWAREGGADEPPPANMLAPPASPELAPPASPELAPPASPELAPIRTTQSNDPSLTVTPPAPQGAKETRAPRRGGADEGEEADDGFAAFEAAWREAEPRHATDRMRPARSVWRGLSEADRAAAADPDVIRAFVADQRRARRTTLAAPLTYLRERMFARIKPASATSGGGGFVPVVGYGRAWWCRWVGYAGPGNRDAEGRPLRGAMMARQMAERARQGTPEGAPLAEAQALERAAAGYVAIRVDSAEFEAWRAWWAARGIELPRPDRVEVIHLPAASPEAWEARAREAAE